MFRCFGHEACGILVPLSGMEPTGSALEGEVLTPGPPGDIPPPLYSYTIFFALHLQHLLQSYFYYENNLCV